ncbi:7-deoxyloganetic acid glucosyl transferase isoform X2 [Hevea brasiliensis]|uniref:7-deoxyloganetic acid glucosyl transferase isoform X2 n=1 Tax=Hevea brasiliensis TaxID=3981 RepID=UPI0025D63F1A|nr:7-deoxyloganetic acid glucosyl transferase isoform X2 [Hevea brasiliensis]
MKQQGSIIPPHVLIFPGPGQGHVNPMLKLAELLGLSGLKVTFLNFQFIHDQLLLHADIEARFTKYPGFQFKKIPDRMSVPRAERPEDMADIIKDLIERMKTSSKTLKKILVENSPPIDCIIADMLMGFVHDVAKEVGIPVIPFENASSCSFWTVLSIPRIIAAGELPIKGNQDMDRLITTVPGMETFLRCRDLPTCCRVNDLADPKLLMITNETRESQALILKTFEDLEAPILCPLRTRYPKIYTIGPLHELLKTKLRSIKKQESYSSLNPLWEVDRTCITWLDNQASHSVLYVSFGSIAIMTREQLMEFWYGLENSKKKFLWVIRPYSVTTNDDGVEEIPEELQEGPKERGYIVKWAPQEEVLAHKAIGGFLAHSGWNSTLESIVAGVPMICWPCFGDQQMNSRFVSEVWKLGMDMKDVCDRKVVEKMVNDLMVDRREEFVKSTARMAELARKSVTEGTHYRA